MILYYYFLVHLQNNMLAYTIDIKLFFLLLDEILVIINAIIDDIIVGISGDVKINIIKNGKYNAPVLTFMKYTIPGISKQGSANK